MPGRKERLEDVLMFIRERRSNEGNFEAIYSKLEEECVAAKTSGDGEEAYLASLEEAREKYAEVYRDAKEQKSSAYPEFEKFIKEFETSVTGALREE